MKQTIPIIKLIKNIAKNPREVIGSQQIMQLTNFLRGYNEGLSTIGKRLEWPFCKFNNWMQEKYDTKLEWDKYLTLYLETEEEEFKEFFSLFGEFLKTYIQECENHGSIEEEIEEIEEFNLYKFLYQIQLRPGMYIGINNIRTFSVYMKGLLKARRDFNLEITQQELEYEGFSDWLVCKKHKLKKIASWEKIYYVYPYTERTLTLFFADYNDYLKDIYNKTLVG